MRNEQNRRRINRHERQRAQRERGREALTSAPESPEPATPLPPVVSEGRPEVTRYGLGNGADGRSRFGYQAWTTDAKPLPLAQQSTNAQLWETYGSDGATQSSVQAEDLSGQLRHQITGGRDASSADIRNHLAHYRTNDDN